MNIAESAAHRATLLCADCGDPFITQINLTMSNTIDLFGQAEKIRFNVVLFAVVSDGKKLQTAHRVKVDLAGMSQNHLCV